MQRKLLRISRSKQPSRLPLPPAQPPSRLHVLKIFVILSDPKADLVVSKSLLMPSRRCTLEDAPLCNSTSQLVLSSYPTKAYLGFALLNTITHLESSTPLMRLKFKSPSSTVQNSHLILETLSFFFIYCCYETVFENVKSILFYKI